MNENPIIDPSEARRGGMAARGRTITARLCGWLAGRLERGAGRLHGVARRISGKKRTYHFSYPAQVSFDVTIRGEPDDAFEVARALVARLSQCDEPVVSTDLIPTEPRASALRVWVGSLTGHGDELHLEPGD